MKIDAIVLAAGKGTRMLSPEPKVLHKLATKPLLQHVIDTLSDLKNCKTHIVIGSQSALVKKSVISPKNCSWPVQSKQLGTGHAVKQALKNVRPNSIVLVLYGDVPLVTSNTMKKLIKVAGTKQLGLLTFELENPKGYGRIIRNARGGVEGIIEEKDASAGQRKITEVNSGILAISSNKIRSLISALKNNNVAKEFYLTDIVSLAVKNQIPVKAVKPITTEEVLGANSLEELSVLERAFHLKQAKELMSKGVGFADLNRVDFRGNIEIKKGSYVDINCIFEGQVDIGSNVKIGAGVIIKNSKIGNGVTLEPYTVVENSILEKGVKAGPYAHIGPEANLSENSEIGNFVEVKRSKIGKGTKAKHLAYIGDGKVEEKVNIGAGTIFVNYDGKNKNKTSVGTGSFIGSNSSLIAPLKIGKNSLIGAGSVITNDIPANKLALSRTKQRNIKKK